MAVATSLVLEHQMEIEQKNHEDAAASLQGADNESKSKPKRRRSSAAGPSANRPSYSEAPINSRRSSMLGRRKSTNVQSAQAAAMDAALAVASNTIKEAKQALNVCEGERDRLRIELKHERAAHAAVQDALTQLEQNHAATNVAFDDFRARTKEIHHRSNAVIKSEMILNDICAGVQARIGRSAGTLIQTNKSKLIQEAYSDPVRLAERIRTNVGLQLDKWEEDRAAATAQVAKFKRAVVEAEAKYGTEHEARLKEVDAVTSEKEHAQEEAKCLRDIIRDLKVEIVAAERREKAVTKSVEEVKEAAATDIAKHKEEAVKKDKELAVQLEKLMEFPRLTEEMHEKMDKAIKSSRREKNLVEIERKEFRRQYAVFLKVHHANTELSATVKKLQSQVVILNHRMLAAQAEQGTGERLKSMAAMTELKKQVASLELQTSKLRTVNQDKVAEVAKLQQQVQPLKNSLQAVKATTYEDVDGNLAKQQEEVQNLRNKYPEINKYMIQQENNKDMTPEDLHISMMKMLKMRARESEKTALLNEIDELRARVRDLQSRNQYLEKEVLVSNKQARAPSSTTPMTPSSAALIEERPETPSTPTYTSNTTTMNPTRTIEDKRYAEVMAAVPASAQRKVDFLMNLKNSSSSSSTDLVAGAACSRKKAGARGGGSATSRKPQQQQQQQQQQQTRNRPQSAHPVPYASTWTGATATSVSPQSSNNMIKDSSTHEQGVSMIRSEEEDCDRVGMSRTTVVRPQSANNQSSNSRKAFGKSRGFPIRPQSASPMAEAWG